MAKTILVAGFGPGISTAVAERFGAEGFNVALVARSADRLGAGVAALKAKGIRAEGFPADLSKPDAIRAVVAKVRTALGPISVVQWSAYGGAAGDLLTATTEDIRGVFDVPVLGLVTTVQAALADLRAEKGAVLVTNGGFGLFDDNIDAAAVSYGAMGLSIANSAKHKTIRLLSRKLAPDGVYVGEVMVMGTVKRSAFDSAGTGTIDPDTVAARFWQQYQTREAPVRWPQKVTDQGHDGLATFAGSCPTLLGEIDSTWALSWPSRDVTGVPVNYTRLVTSMRRTHRHSERLRSLSSARSLSVILKKHTPLETPPRARVYAPQLRRCAR